SARYRPGEVRDASPCAPRRAPRVRRCGRLWLVTTVVLHGTDRVPARRLAGTATAETWTSAASQAHRRRACVPSHWPRRHPLCPGDDGVGGGVEGPVRDHRTPSQHRTQSAEVHRAPGKKTTLTRGEAPNDPQMYETHYEAVRAQVIGTGVPLRGVGLAVLLQEGLASWILALRVCISWSRLPVTAATVLVRPGCDETATITSGLHTDLLSAAQYTELAQLLASLVLSARPLPQPSLVIQERPYDVK